MYKDSEIENKIIEKGFDNMSRMIVVDNDGDKRVDLDYVIPARGRLIDEAVEIVCPECGAESSHPMGAVGELRKCRCGKQYIVPRRLAVD